MPEARHDLSLLITSYLAARHPDLARVVEEAVGPGGADDVLAEAAAIERAILDGDFGAIEGLLVSSGLVGPQRQKAFLYLCWKQQFLEFVDNRESQKAFNLLQKRLKPLEHYQPVPYDFYTLSYLLSASTVHDAPGLRDWAGAGPERERLVGKWRELVSGRRRIDGAAQRHVSPDRLETLVRQAAAWQIAHARGRASGPWTVTSLLHDYYVPRIPSRMERMVSGHTANVKCVAFVTDVIAVSGSSDATLRMFDVDTGTTLHVLAGHASRIWDVDATDELIASGSGDGSVRVWGADGASRAVLPGDGGDVYGVRWRPGHRVSSRDGAKEFSFAKRQGQVATACYDKILRLWDVEAGREVRTFSGHAQSTQCVAFDPAGSIIASGSKDKHVRLWDATGGVCVHTMTAQLGEITSVAFDDMGRYLLAGCKDNSNRLWDLRMQRNLYRYVGHQNTSKNLIRAAFANPSSTLIASGSEDGLVYLWDREASAAPARSPALLPAGAAAASAPTTTNGLLSSGHGPAGASATFSPRLASSAAERASPAYYPPRETRTARPAPTTLPVRPVGTLAGHGAGCVFGVAARGGRLLSAGDDGMVGVWGPNDA